MRTAVIRGALAAAALATAALLAACGSSPGGNGSSGSVHAAASSLAANPTVQADVQAAQGLLADCVKQHPGSLSGIKACVLSQVPADKQAALKACLVTAAANDAKADHHIKAALKDFETSSVSGRGAQPCIAAALKAPVPGASANIPGVTVTPTTTSTS
jgi:hypothetical protein